MIRYGIVGVGGFASRYLQALGALEQTGVARLAAAVVRNPDKYAPQVAALKSKGCVIYATLDEMLTQGRGRIDIVGVPTGIAQHAPMSKRAMEAGYPVLMEKPVAATIQEVSDLRRVERRTGRWCAVGYQFIYSSTIQWLKEKLLEGRLGAIREARTAIGWPRGTGYYARNPWAAQLQAEGRWVLDGPATNATAHHLTNMLYLAMAQRDGKEDISSVRAELYRARAVPGYDTSCIEVTLSDGARLLHYATHALDQAVEPFTDYMCERGTIRWEAEGNVAVIRYDDGTSERHAGHTGPDLHLRLFEQVSHVVEGKEPTPLCGLAEGEPHVLTIDLAFESSGGITTIPAAHTYEGMAGDGTAATCVKGMRELLLAAQEQGVLFSELGVPWAKPTAPVAAAGYEWFPRNPDLPRALGVEAL